MPLHVETDRDVIVVKFNARALDESNVHQVGEELYRRVEKVSRPQLRLDFGGVEYLTSTALGKLVGLYRKVRAAKRFPTADHPTLATRAGTG